MSKAFVNELRACAAQSYPEVAPVSILGLLYPSWSELIGMAERGQIDSWADIEAVAKAGREISGDAIGP